MRSSRRRQLIALAGGLVGVAVIVVTFYLLDPKVHSGIPALLLLVPITVASAVGGWRVAAGVAVGGTAPRMPSPSSLRSAAFESV